MLTGISSGPYYLLILFYCAFISSVLLANVIAHGMAFYIGFRTRRNHGDF